MAVMNCWEYKSCGRERGGTRVDDLGVFTASANRKAKGIKRGLNRRMACWAIAGTLCNEKVQGTFASKLPTCTTCNFYDFVRIEEGANFNNAHEIRELME
jgi:hypothetical protein